MAPRTPQEVQRKLQEGPRAPKSWPREYQEVPQMPREVPIRSNRSPRHEDAFPHFLRLLKSLLELIACALRLVD